MIQSCQVIVIINQRACAAVTLRSANHSEGDVTPNKSRTYNLHACMHLGHILCAYFQHHRAVGFPLRVAAANRLPAAVLRTGLV